MVSILPPKTNIGAQIGAGIGSGLAQGSQAGLERSLQQQRLNQILSMAYPQQGSQMDQGGAPPQPGQQSDPPSAGSQGPQVTPAQILALASQDPQLAKFLQDQQFQAQKMSQKEREFGFQEKKLALDETKDYRNSLQDQSQSATELAPVLDQMENLINTGKLTNPVIAKLADKAGLVGLLDPTSQQYQGLAVGFLKDAKNIFGSRVTNFDLQTYIDKIPRLSQTDAGKRVLIDNFRTLGEASKVRNRIKNQVIRENGGVPPFDLQEQVEEKSAPLLDKIADKFNSNIYKQIGQSLPSMPEASKYSGRTVLDEETGQKFKSNGKEWVPQ